MTKTLPPELRLPDESPRLLIHRYQWFTLPAIFLLPLLSVAGLFDEKRTVAKSRSKELVVTVEYPERLRHSMPHALNLTVFNASGRFLDTMRLELDSGYAGAFSDLRLLPEESGPFSVDLRGLAPGAARRARILAKAETWGGIRGALTAHEPHGSDTVKLKLRTFILP